MLTLEAPFWSQFEPQQSPLGKSRARRHPVQFVSCFTSLQDFTGEAKRIQATGGFARSAFWRQMMADVFDREVTVPEQYESSCLGAAVLGLYALKEISSFNIVSDMIGETHRHQPIAANVETYKRFSQSILASCKTLKENTKYRPTPSRINKPLRKWA
jgi:sugar (pentulose or hexulose) kinase